MKKVGKAEPPKGLTRLFWRAPIWIYRLGLGGLIKSRMLLLHHTGRRSGLPRQNVLEIVDYDKVNDTYYVAAGFGKKSDWYLNILEQPAVTIVVGREEKAVTAVALSPDLSGAAMVEYSKRNPKAAKGLMRICGYEVDGSDEDYLELGHDYIPFIALQPRVNDDRD